MQLQGQFMAEIHSDLVMYFQTKSVAVPEGTGYEWALYIYQDSSSKANLKRDLKVITNAIKSKKAHYKGLKVIGWATSSETFYDDGTDPAASSLATKKGVSCKVVFLGQSPIFHPDFIVQFQIGSSSPIFVTVPFEGSLGSWKGYGTSGTLTLVASTQAKVLDRLADLTQLHLDSDHSADDDVAD